ncbi:hypothetical protein LCGC14_2504430 [marine sediment metagenome]|uniref:NAD-dependent epimerase/dehydratase domain-containing protein n=1 Tax=marine sediment metagenome TaxID=412755 RepID=A0A0F9B1M8_9ZZZZ
MIFSDGHWLDCFSTGGSGLIGKALCKRLFKEKHIGLYNIDLRNNRAINDINRMDMFPRTEKVDILFHLASPVKINRCIKYPALANQDIANGTFQVLEFCRENKIPKVVYFSSSRVLSKEKNPYVAAKIYSEELVKAYSKCYGLKYLIIRPSTVYGPGKDKSNRLINKWIWNAKEDRDIGIYGDKNKTLSFTYIDDFIDGLMKALKDGWNKEYNICGKEEKLSIVAKRIKKLTNSDSEIFYPDMKKDK